MTESFHFFQTPIISQLCLKNSNKHLFLKKVSQESISCRSQLKLPAKIPENTFYLPNSNRTSIILSYKRVLKCRLVQRLSTIIMVYNQITESSEYESMSEANDCQW